MINTNNTHQWIIYHIKGRCVVGVIGDMSYEIVHNTFDVDLILKLKVDIIYISDDSKLKLNNDRFNSILKLCYKQYDYDHYNYYRKHDSKFIYLLYDIHQYIFIILQYLRRKKIRLPRFMWHAIIQKINPPREQYFRFKWKNCK